ncbi:nucleoside diphosphate kinase 2, chloroplastic, partial [Tanacetum coccineum]
KELAYNQGDILRHVYTPKVDLEAVSLELTKDQTRLKQSSNSKKRKLRNLVHGSDILENGQREIALWFKEGEIFMAFSFADSYGYLCTTEENIAMWTTLLAIKVKCLRYSSSYSHWGLVSILSWFSAMECLDLGSYKGLCTREEILASEDLLYGSMVMV